MKSVYISSTRKDLKEHLEAAGESLRRCGYDVETMEKYPARDDRPRSACQADVVKCDIYLGVFAWVYGFAPAEDNPDCTSITELEYLAAGRAQKPRLIFLMDDDYPWPSSLRDSERQTDAGKRIRDLRNRLRVERWTAFFKSPDDLAKQVLTSVFQFESTHRIQSTAAIEEVQTAAELGASYLSNLQQKLAESGSTPFIAIRLGPTPWWNTRLHLVSALASDFTEIRQFVLLDSEGRVLIVSSPLEIRRALTKSQLKLELAYLQCREQARGPLATGEVDFIVSVYPGAILSVHGGRAENLVKQVITPSILRELGIKQQGEVLEQFAPDQRPFSSADIMRRRERHVVLVRGGNLEGVVDRVELATRMARGAL
jgi:hypothetical protein